MSVRQHASNEAQRKRIASMKLNECLKPPFNAKITTKTHFCECGFSAKYEFIRCPLCRKERNSCPIN